MPVFKSGARLRSQVDATEVIVVKAPPVDLDLRIGGHPAIDLSAEPAAGLVAAEGQESALVGKRYTRAEGDLEVLVTKAGGAGLVVDGAALATKESKPLPSSD